MSCSSRTSRTSLMRSGRTGSISAKAKRRSSSRTATAERNSSAACQRPTGASSRPRIKASPLRTGVRTRLVEMLLGVGDGAQVAVEQHEAEAVALGLGDAMASHAAAHVVRLPAKRGVRIVSHEGDRVLVAADTSALKLRDHVDARRLAFEVLQSKICFDRKVGQERGLTDTS